MGRLLYVHNMNKFVACFHSFCVQYSVYSTAVYVGSIVIRYNVSHNVIAPNVRIAINEAFHLMDPLRYTYVAN